MNPACWLHEDGQHFWWHHKCVERDTSHLDAETARICTEMHEAPKPLPLGPDGWNLVQSDPLTISPSILCGECGIHGFWTDGRWVQV